MEYIIKKPTLGDKNSIKISKEKYENVKKAKNNLLEVLNIEEKFDLLLENYKEYEQELLNVTLNYALFTDLNWSSSKDKIHSIDRKIINLLTVCKLYLDHIPHNIKQIYEDNELKNKFKKKTHEKYDNHLGYRVLEALRNYVQHRGLPTHHLRYKGESIDFEKGNKVKYVIVPFLRISELKQDKKFKSEVLEELEQYEEKVDLRPFIREYVEALGKIHIFIRKEIETDLKKWDSLLYDVMEIFKEEYNDDFVSLSIIKRKNTGHIVNQVNIFDEMIKRRKYLERKNRIANFTKNIITNEID